MDNISKNILKTIKSEKFNNIFFNVTSNRKYNIKTLIESIVFILK
jgi:hypothetical protein